MKIRLSEPVTRVEGISELVIHRDGSRILDVTYRMPTARDFETVLVGQRIEDLPKMAARICGICPVAHRVASVKAVEAALHINVPPLAETLRELAMLGEIIRSHTFSVFFSTLPDLMALVNPLPRNDIFGINSIRPKILPRALKLYRCGEMLAETAAGQANTAFTIVPGGVLHNITGDQQAELLKQLHSVLSTVRWAKELYSWLLHEVEGDIQAFTVPSPLFVSCFDTQANRFYGTDNIEFLSKEGRLLTIPCSSFDQHLAELSQPDAPTGVIYAAANNRDTPLLTGPHARLAVLETSKSPEREQPPMGDPNLFQAGLLRLDEIKFAVTSAINLLEGEWDSRGEVLAKWSPREGEGGSCVEAPRGTLLYWLKVNGEGKVSAIKIRVPTELNAQALVFLVKKVAVNCLDLGWTSEQVIEWTKMAVRCFDPCVSCATHTDVKFRD